ncbi:MAG TPA: nucleotidyltransferase family protein [Candidatus Kapabacteria bacterium]|nr:nucleotidyltransferase family protein [Candidatus Kapabacteria bacterium]
MQLDGLSVPDQAFTELLKKYHVKELALFGSRARGDNRPDSDVDFLVDYETNVKIDLFDFIALKLDMEELLGVSVDLVEREALKPRVRDRVLSEARSIYAN